MSYAICRQKLMKEAERSERSRLVAIQENRFHRLPEQFPHPQREREAGIVLSRLDAVDSLPRNGKSVRQVRLLPVAFGAQDLEAILHE
jgi:hypothetical protein